MKLLQRSFVLLLAAAMLLTLSSCSEKVKPENIDTKDYSREIRLDGSCEGVEILHADQSSQSAQPGQVLQSDDGVRVDAGAELILNADDDKHVYGQENSYLRLEASGTSESGKTRICLEEGSVLVGLDEPLSEGELFEIQTQASTVSVSDGIVRVTKINEAEASYTLVEVFEGEASVVIRQTGEKALIVAGEAALVNETGKKPSIVLSDEIDQDFWKSSQTTGLQVGKDGTGSMTLPIPYSKLPVPVLEQLLDYAKDGRKLSVSEATLTNLIETGHDYVETIVKEATCTEEGQISMECALCGDQSEKTVPAVGHVEEEIPGTDAACTEDGLTAGAKCAVCGEVLAEQEMIPALGHQPEEDAAVEATCTQEGRTAGTRCAVCGEVLTGYEVIPALGHQEVEVAAVEATCTQEGRTAGTRCEVCGEVLSGYEVIPALGHQEVEDAAVEATCTQEGKTAGSHCAVCGEVLTPQQIVPALGHQVHKDDDVPATCTEDGLIGESRCTVCGAVIEEAKVIPALGHQLEELPAVAPTCEKDGLTAG
ncbi:MAG: hypothetical protein ACI3XG_11370, partial [Faecousia sp.]